MAELEFTYLFDGKAHQNDIETIKEAVNQYNDLRVLDLEENELNYDLFDFEKIKAFIKYIEDHPSDFEGLKNTNINLAHPALLLSKSVAIKAETISKGFSLSQETFDEWTSALTYNDLNVDALLEQKDKAYYLYQKISEKVKKQQTDLKSLEESPEEYKSLLESLSLNRYKKFVLSKTRYWNLAALKHVKKDDEDYEATLSRALTSMQESVVPPRYSVLSDQ